MTTGLPDFFQYNLWANLGLLDACAHLSDAQLDATTRGTFGSVRETLMHLFAAEEGYVRHFTGTTPIPPLKELTTFAGFDELFVIVNGIRFDDDDTIRELDTPYPGGNLFSLASGGAIYLRDPQQQVTGDQLNGGEFAPLTVQDWALIQPYLEENESIFGIPLNHLLTMEGSLQPPARVYRKIRPVGHKALMPEETWVKREA
jgi:hypothetical protein